MRLLISNNARIDPKSIDDYLAIGGYGALAKALFQMSPEQVLGEIKKKQAVQAMEVLAKLAYKEAKNTFVVPGLGKLVLVQRPARKMIMRFGPKAAN